MSSEARIFREQRDELLEALRGLCDRFKEIEPELNGQTAFCANHGLLWTGPSLEQPLKVAPALLAQYKAGDDDAE